MTINNPIQFDFAFKFDMGLGSSRGMPITDEQAGLLYDTITQDEFERRFLVNGVAWKDLSELDTKRLNVRLAALIGALQTVEQRPSVSPESVGYEVLTTP